MPRAKAYKFNPSHIVYLSTYFMLSIFLSLSIYLIFNQDIVDFILGIGDNTFISMQDLDFIAFGDFKQLLSRVSMFFSAVLLLNLIILYLTIKTTAYIVVPSKNTIKIKKGIIAKQIDVIKIPNIQDIDISISIIERILGLGTLIIYTSGDMSAVSDRLTALERKRLNEVNKNVVMNYMSIRKMLSITRPQAVMDLILRNQKS